MIRVLPPGPFPAPGGTPNGAVDLAWRVADTRYTGSWLGGPGRAALSERLREALRAGDLAEASAILDDFLATFPLASVVDGARRRWAQGPDGAALAVLARAARVVARAESWATLPGAPWPVPDAAWVRGEVDDGPWTLARRDRFDGAAEIAAILDVPLAEPPAPSLPFQDVPVEALADQRAALGRALATGALRGVRWHGPEPTDPEGQCALGEIRLEGSHQAALEAVGLAGLLVDALPAFTDLLEPPGPGLDGQDLRTACAWGVFPGTPADLARGVVRPVTWLLWDGPHAPLPVDPAVMPVLAAFKEGAPRDDAPPEHAALIPELIRLGALSAS